LQGSPNALCVVSFDGKFAFFNQIILFAQFNMRAQRWAIVSCPDFLLTLSANLQYTEWTNKNRTM